VISPNLPQEFVKTKTPTKIVEEYAYGFSKDF
jgi:hypothetical protein